MSISKYQNPCWEKAQWQFMASIGAEDLKKGASQPSLNVRAKSAVIRSSKTCASSDLIERKWHSPSAFVDSVPLPHVKVVYERPHNFSGISSQRASPSVPAAVTCAQSTGAYSSSSGSRDTRARSAGIKSSVHRSGLPTVCQSTCHLEPVIHGYQSHRNLNPLRLRSRLLGKRAFAPPLSIYPPCPSPPKTPSHKASLIVDKIMPANQSHPWSQAKLRNSNNGVIRSSTAKVPIIPRLETKDLKSGAVLSGKIECNTDKLLKHSQTAVPLEGKYTDVPPNHISVLSEYDTIMVENAKENSHIVECCVAHEASEAPQRVMKVSSGVEFTAAVRQLTKNRVHMSNGTLNGLSGPLMANFDSQCNRSEVWTGANSATQASVCLINGREEFHMDTNPCDALCLEENSLNDGTTQARICAIPDDTDCKIDSPQSPTVYSVINQISAIHLTKDHCQHTSEENLSQCSMTLDEGVHPDVRG